MPQQSSPKPLKDPWEPPKVALGEPRKRPGAPSQPPSAPRGAPRSRQGENMQTAAEGAPTPPSQPEHLVLLVARSPPRSKPTFNPSSSHRSRLPAPAGLPPRRTRGVGGLTGLRPLPPTPKEDLAVSNMRMARSDFSYEYLDEEFNPRRMMLNQDESCSRHLNQLPR